MDDAPDPLPPGVPETLLARAREATALAYAPYSTTRIGAALLTRSGRVHVGANIGNASSALNGCAEQSALVSAVMAGDRDLVAVAVAQDTRETTPPCGRCLQLLAEFAEDMAVVTDGPTGPVVWRLRHLLPHPFRRARLPT